MVAFTRDDRWIAAVGLLGLGVGLGYVVGRTSASRRATAVHRDSDAARVPPDTHMPRPSSIPAALRAPSSSPGSPGEPFEWSPGRPGRLVHVNRTAEAGFPPSAIRLCACSRSRFSCGLSTREGRNNTGKSPVAVSAVEHYRLQRQQPTSPVSLEIDGRPVPVFCVNLARRPERWAAMRLRLAASLTPEDAARVERVDAVDGAALSDEQLRQCLTRRA
jgi:hypothetical protein